MPNSPALELASAPTTRFSENVRGIVAMVLCNTLFLINDAQLKLVSQDMPVGEVLFFRSLISLVIIGVMVAANGQIRYVGQVTHWAVGVRCIAETGGAFLFLYALIHTPIANMNAILQVVPLMITAAGAVFLGEYVGWRRWTAIAIGFIGVLIIIRPGLAGFNVFSLVALAAMLFVTLKELTTRIIPRFTPALIVAGAMALVTGLASAVYGLTEDWIAPEWKHIALLVSASAFLVAGYYTSIVAMRHGDIAVTAPFRYASVISAIIVGFTIWGEVPDALMIVGTTIIIGTGIYTFYRERRLALARAAE